MMLTIYIIYNHICPILLFSLLVSYSLLKKISCVSKHLCLALGRKQSYKFAFCMVTLSAYITFRVVTYSRVSYVSIYCIYYEMFLFLYFFLLYGFNYVVRIIS